MARYHYNPATGKTGACRADPSKPNSRGCKFSLAEDQHYATQEEAARAYEATQDPFLETGLTLQQENYFSRSAIRDQDGRLLEVHHGSANDFDSFDPERLGRGNDSWGNGFYFTSNRGTADSYSDGKGSRSFYINVTNPLRVDGREALSLTDVVLTPEQSRSIVLAHPDLQLQPDLDGELTNPLSDYSEEYWSRDHHTPQQLQSMAEKVARDYFTDVGWVELESFYGRERGQSFLQAVSKATGYDGVEVDFGEEDGKFVVAWFPEQIKLSSNGSPTESSSVSG